MREEVDERHGDSMPGQLTELTASSPVSVSRELPPKLCGYLNKLSGKGPLKGFKSRWFVFEPLHCHLYYFKGPSDAIPLGFIDIADASFTYDLEAEEGQLEIHSGGRDYTLKAPSAQAMRYWLQELQQKRWEFSNNGTAGSRDNRVSPPPPYSTTGLVAKDVDGPCLPQAAMDVDESARNVLDAVDVPETLVGERAASYPSPVQPTTINFSLKHWGTEIRNSMSNLKPGRGNNENRKSVFYTEDWELIEPSLKELEEAAAQEERRKNSTEPSRGSAFSFDFARATRVKRPPFLRDMIGTSKNRNSSESSPVEWIVTNGKASTEIQTRIQAQQEELNKVKEDLISQKELVRLLQQTLKHSQEEKYLLNPGASMDEGMSQFLQQKNHQIQALNNQLDHINQQKDHMEQELKAFQDKITGLNDQLNMFRETIQAKDEVIMKLSQQLNECENMHSPPGVFSGSTVAPSVYKELQELDTLKDSLQGYKTQNKFLNKEILELSALKRNAEIREKALEAKYSGLEARLCQVESKYLVLLQEVKNPVCSGGKGPTHEVISRLLEDALKVDSAEHPEQTTLKPHPVRLAGIALLYLEQEEAFWCLVAITECFMTPDYYTKNLIGSQVDQRVLKDLLSEKLPRLHAHFEQHKVDFSLITFNWFLVIFVDSVVSDIMFRIWDSFLYEGPKVIFRYALAVFKFKEDEFLKLQDNMSIFKYLRYFTHTILDARKLTNIAFVDMNPFPMRLIHSRRTFHLEKVRQELNELEAIRQDFLRERETATPDRRDVISDDDEDT
ncbi:TBC1 domain family member 2B isoform X2 [Stegostoma tigrinum]|uniref:TBC1 domain family member 2B isoform X2 n=1 Tax=Stegostoma tigrinum TaxID=3053191 RepID=UPI00286FE968|nr:TBC1 domain family member 2B isoform X2 [Stegostoma tigrinum]